LTVGMTEADVLKHLAKKYAAPEFVFLPRVRNGTGYSRTRTRYADAVAMSVWPSRGLDLHGFEVKVSRSDWLREKKNPQKADDVAAFCDRWWLAVSDPEIVQPGELPSAWGLYVVKAGKVVCETPAEKLEAKPPDRLLLGSLLRATADSMVPRLSIQDEVNAAAKAADAAARSELKYKMADLERRANEADEWLEELREKTGVCLNRWDHGNQGVALKALTSILRFRKDADGFHDGLFGAVNRVRVLLGELEAVAKALGEVRLPGEEAQESARA